MNYRTKTPPVRAAGRRRAEGVRIFARRFVKHTKDRWKGSPFLLEPWQWRDIVLPIYGCLSPRGLRLYNKAYIGLPRWQGKDEIVAMLALHHLFLEPVAGGEAYAVAASRAQAGILFETAREMVNADPRLRLACDVYRREIVVRETGCILRCLPHDADTSQGLHPSFCAIDEAHVYRDRRMIDAMLSGSIGREEPLLIIITTAGEQARGVWWDVLHEWIEDPTAYVYFHGAPDDADPTDPRVWRRANPASWITDEMLARQFRALPLASFERYHLNRVPQAGTGRVFAEKLWRACAGQPVIDPERPCVVAVDASLRRDHTAVVLDQLDEDLVHNVLCFTFTADEDGSIMRAIDHDQVGNLLRELAASYNVTRLPCDRAYFVRTMRQLLDEGLPVEEFPQTNQNMARACQRMYDAVTEGRLRHGGDPVLSAHIMGAAVKETPFGWRIQKRDSSAHIDAAVALAMAMDIAEAETDAPGSGPSFAATGGVWTIGA